MRIAFIGCVKFSAVALEMLFKHPAAELVGVITRNESAVNSDFHNLTPLAQQAGCEVYIYDDKNNQSDMASWLRDRRPDVIYCLGWSNLLTAEILKIPPLGVVGYHPAALPQNRGRHPIIWALALGLQQTASTFFMMDAGADSGDILDQVPVTINHDDDAGSLYQKLIETALPQLYQLTKALADGSARRTPQDHTRANYWRKRTAEDGRIDWRMPALGIHNLVRALAHPYPGAHCEVNGQTIKVWQTNPLDSAPQNFEPGKVLQVTDNRIQVKCGDSAIELLNHGFDVLPAEGSYL